MSWFRVDDNCPDHPKWLNIPAKDRASAFALYIALGCRSARFATDGDCGPIGELSGVLGLSKRKISSLYLQLIDAKFLSKTEDNRAIIHDYLDYNMSAAEDAQRRENAREKKRRQRQKNDDSEGDVPGGQNRDPLTRPDPTRPETPPLDKSNVVVTLSGPGDEEAQEPEFIASDPAHRSVYTSAYQALRKSWARNYEHRTGLQFNSSWFSVDHARIKSFAEMVADNASGVDGARRMAEDLVNGFYASRKKNHFRWEYIQGSESEYLTRGAELRKRAAA